MKVLSILNNTAMTLILLFVSRKPFYRMLVFIGWSGSEEDKSDTDEMEKRHPSHLQSIPMLGR